MDFDKGNTYNFGIGFIHIQFIVNKLLEDFLIENNCLDEFVINAKKSKIQKFVAWGSVHNANFRSLSSSFIFNDTSKPDYWRKLSDEFDQYQFEYRKKL